jgi:hypothetical protein
MAFGDYSIDPMSNYESPMYGPMPDYSPPDYIHPLAQFSAGSSGSGTGGYTPMGAMLFGDNVYNIYVSVMNWIRMTRPLE